MNFQEQFHAPVVSESSRQLSAEEQKTARRWSDFLEKSQEMRKASRADNVVIEAFADPEKTIGLESELFVWFQGARGDILFRLPKNYIIDRKREFGDGSTLVDRNTGTSVTNFDIHQENGFVLGRDGTCIGDLASISHLYPRGTDYFYAPKGTIDAVRKIGR